VSLPMFPQLKGEQQLRVVAQTVRFLSEPVLEGLGSLAATAGD